MTLTSAIARAYIFVMLLLLPMDWFSPTGLTLREFGAKPATPLLVFGGIIIVFARPLSSFRLGSSMRTAGFCLGVVAITGSCAFLLNLGLAWSEFGTRKDPTTQFMGQGVLFIFFIVAVLAHADFFRQKRWRDYAVSVIPVVLAIHLAVILMEASGLLSTRSGWLSLFRTQNGMFIERPSGLMSEPSYFGAFAALYGIPLLLLMGKKHRVYCWAMATTAFAIAIGIRGKTIVPVTICELVALVWFRGLAKLRLKHFVATAVVAVASLLLIVAGSALDLRDNLSSVMRIGSTQLAMNVAASGYGATGIGFGQFHFFYRDEFAPHYMLISEEARDQMSTSADSRASTYNFFVRLLVETGLIGLLGFLACLYGLFQRAKGDDQSSTLFGILLCAGSCGFLCTQDTYFYPPLVVGLALILGRVTEIELMKMKSRTHIGNRAHPNGLGKEQHV